MIQRLIIFSSTIVGTYLAVSLPVFSQIIPDHTANTAVSGNCQTTCEINEGTIAGQNLFHSFEEFNLSTGSNVYFADPGVANIFSRVTGNNPSTIFGTLGVMGGDANLFLLNPNGIMFGEGATLDLNGSFFATTADHIQFGEDTFSAIPEQQENLTLLTVDPSALFFNQMGQNGSIVLEGAELSVSEGKNLTLLGQGNRDPGILLKNSDLTVTKGNISLGSLGKLDHNTEIALQNDFQLGFPANTPRGDITLTESSQINSTHYASYADLDNQESQEIRLQSHNLELKDNSKIATITFSNIPGADIDIDAQGTVKIMGESGNVFQKFLASNFTPGVHGELPSGLQTTAFGSGNAGGIEISTPNLKIDQGAGIISGTRGAGKSGNINLDVVDTFTLSNSGLLSASGTGSVGDVGEINIMTKQLLVEQNGIISASTLGNGDAGNLNIAASEVIKVGDTPLIAAIPTGIYTNTVFGNGAGGDLKIDTPQLVLQNGGMISAASGSLQVTKNGFDLIPWGGKGGNIELNVAEFIKVGGKSGGDNFTSSILSDTRSDNPAGNLTINTGDLYIDADGLISASSVGNGAGGNILVNARNMIQIDGSGVNNLQTLVTDGLTGKLNQANVKGGIVAFTRNRGAAGNITINTSELNLDRGGMISAASYGDDHAGNLQINATEFINVHSSAIISPTFAAGDGGKLDLSTKNLTISGGGAIASASTGSGKAGNIDIWATESISIEERIPNLLFSGSISTGSYGGIGSSGNLQIDTQRLSIRDGANIQANNILLNPIDPQNIPVRKIARSVPGKLTINAAESLEILGSSILGQSVNNSLNSYISSTTNTLNPASDVVIHTGKLSVFDGGEISVSSFGEGAAGKLEIAADAISLKNVGNLTGTTLSGQGGNILLQVNDFLRLKDNSFINTNAIALGNGGNIEISANFVIVSGNSSISANAADMGHGGNINITANDIFLTPNSAITADSALGIDGTVKVKTLVDTEHRNYGDLPQQVLQTDSKITRSCGNKGDRQSVFSYIGRGGLPFNPLTEFQGSNTVIADFDIPSDTPTNIDIYNMLEANQELDLAPQQTSESTAEATVEATQWRVNYQGKVELIAPPRQNPISFDFMTPNCPLSKL
ncbi:MAG: filamentous hemagglutinin N-terminal domain-containing protein [Waterburya sp.]